MKILMDADCLIKLTKAGLKETVCSNDNVFIPSIVAEKLLMQVKSKDALMHLRWKKTLI